MINLLEEEILKIKKSQQEQRNRIEKLNVSVKEKDKFWMKVFCVGD